MDERSKRYYVRGRHLCAECGAPMPPDCAKLAFCSNDCKAAWERREEDP